MSKKYKYNKKRGIVLKIYIAILMTVLFLIFTGTALAFEEKANITSEEKIEQMIKFIEEQEKAKSRIKFVSGQDVKDSGSVKSNPNVIEARGKMPTIDTELKKQVLFERYYDIGDAIGNEITKYSYPDGPVIGYGYNINGYLEVDFLEGSKIDDELIGNFYNMYSQEATKNGIMDVPVVFLYTKLPVTDANRFQYIRPLIGGIQVEVGNISFSTANVAAKERDGTVGYLISAHSAAKGGVGGIVWQPSNRSASYQAGTISSYVDYYADAAFVEYSNVIPRLYLTAYSYVDIVSWNSPFANNTSVAISGKNTGLSSGEIIGFRNEVVFTDGTNYDLWVADYMAMRGDSGAPIWSPVYGKAEILGIHVGGNGTEYFSPMSGAMRDLDILPYVNNNYYDKGDFNYDGAINMADLSRFALSYNNILTYHSSGDFDNDGDIDMADLSGFALVYDP